MLLFKQQVSVPRESMLVCASVIAAGVYQIFFVKKKENLRLVSFICKQDWHLGKFLFTQGVMSSGREAGCSWTQLQPSIQAGGTQRQHQNSVMGKTDRMFAKFLSLSLIFPRVSVKEHKINVSNQISSPNMCCQRRLNWNLMVVWPQLVFVCPWLFKMRYLQYI